MPALTPLPRGFNLKEWFESPYSTNTSSLPGLPSTASIPSQLQCYALPYGLIGFISHLLTYWTMYLLSRGLDPLFPWCHLRHKCWNISVSAIGLLVTIVVTILTIIRCKNGWQLILVATWKLVFSLTLSAMALHAATLIDWKKIKAINKSSTAVYTAVNGKGSNPSRVGIIPISGNESRAGLVNELDKVESSFSKIMIWSPILAIGGIIGFIGIASLVKANIATNHQLKIITIVFGATAAVVGLGTMVCAMIAYPEQRCLVSNVFGSFLFGAMCCLVALTVLFALYSDWVLGALANDLTGVPSQDVLVVYLVYFLAKRLPMFSF